MNKTVMQHESLRVPQGWDGQDKALVVQLSRIFDDIYKRFGNLRLEDLGEGLRAMLAEMQETDTSLQNGKADKSEAIKNITRSGTTYTATRADGTTFTFTQQDNDHYAWDDITGKPAFSGGSTTLAWDTESTIATVAGSAVKVKLPANPNTDHYAWSDITGKPSYYDGTAIKNITRSGTTFTATKMDGTTFTFTQQDNNTTYSAGSGLALSGTEFRINVPRVAESANHLPGANSFMLREYQAGSNYNLPSNHWYHIYEAKGSDGNYGTQLALGMTTTAAYYRNYSGGSWQAWKSIIDTNTTYTLDGLGGAKKSEAIKSISRSGTTFTATRCDGTTFTFTQQDNNTTYSFSDKNVTLAWGTKSTIATVGGTDIHVTMPANPNTNTWRPVKTYTGTYTTTASGNIVIGGDWKYTNRGILSIVCTNATTYVVLPYRGGNSEALWCHIITDNASNTVVASKSVTVRVSYFEI